MANRPLITIYKRTQKPEPVKSCSLYISTHEKITALQRETGLAIPQLLKIAVDLLVDYAVISDEQAPSFKLEVQEGN